MTSLMKPSEALRKARELLTPEGAWTKEGWARNKQHWFVAPESPNAVCWCARGALRKVSGGYTREELDAEIVLQDTLGLTHTGSIADWNDAEERTQDDVLEAFTKAIALAEEAGQ